MRWRGEPIGSLREDYHRELIYIGHAPAVKDDLTARENVAISCALGGAPVARATIERNTPERKRSAISSGRYTQSAS